MRDQKMRFWKGIREDGMEFIVATRGGTSFCSPEVAACSPAYAIRMLKDGRNILRNCFNKVKKAAKNEGLALDRTLLVGAVLMPLDRRGRVNPGNRFIGAVAEFRKDGFWQAIKCAQTAGEQRRAAGGLCADARCGRSYDSKGIKADAGCGLTRP